jgi:hypothetical protein
MTLIGGGGSGAGGAGNPVGGNPAGVGTGLNYIGNHAYANSGEVLVNNNTVTMLEFTTGSSYFVGSFSYGVDQNASLGGSKLIGFTISLDGQKIMQLVTQTATNYPIIDIDNNYQLLIPPYTKVKIESETTNSTNVPTYAMLTGRVYA